MAVTSDGQAARSTDGQTSWTAAAALPNPGVSWKSITYGEGVFVAVSSNSGDWHGNKAAWSDDKGQNWHEATLPDSADWSSVTYGGGVFVAVASNSNTAAWSADGKTWTAAGSLPDSGDWSSVAYGEP
jgi:hypothetical protein